MDRAVPLRGRAGLSRPSQDLSHTPRPQRERKHPRKGEKQPQKTQSQRGAFDVILCVCRLRDLPEGHHSVNCVKLPRFRSSLWFPEDCL